MDFGAKKHSTNNLLAAVGGATLAFTLAGIGGPIKAQSPINGPAPGVLCDQNGGVCYDRQGPSIGLTQTYLGSIAAGRLSETLRNQPAGSDFRLSNGAVCDLRAASCWSDGWQKNQLATKLTMQLFGTLPTGQSGLQGLQTPQQGVICDPAGQICYDQQGISLGLTRNYFGPRAERSLLNQFGNQPMPREYRLSNGSACSVPARTCWSDGWNKRNVNQQLTTHLFGASNQVLSKENGNCRLDDWGLRIYNGRCRLIRAIGNPDFRGSTYSVRIPNREEVVFGNRNGYLVARTGGRNWSAQFENLGNNTAVFRWGTKQLLVNTLVYGSNGSYGTPPVPSATYNTPYRNNYTGNGVNWNGAIEGFLNGLFQ